MLFLKSLFLATLTFGFAVGVVFIQAAAASELMLPNLAGSACAARENFLDIELPELRGTKPVAYVEALHEPVYTHAAALLESAWEAAKRVNDPQQGAIASEAILIASATWLIAASVPQGTDLDGVRARTQANTMQRLALAWLGAIESGEIAGENRWLEQAVRAELALVAPKHRNRVPPEVALALRVWLDVPSFPEGLRWPLDKPDWSGEEAAHALLRVTFAVPQGFLARWLSDAVPHIERVEAVAMHLRDHCSPVAGHGGAAGQAGDGVSSDSAELQTAERAISLLRNEPITPAVAEIDWLLDELEKQTPVLREHEVYRLCRIAEWIENALTIDPTRELNDLAILEPNEQRKWLQDQRKRWRGLLLEDATNLNPENTQEQEATFEALDKVFPPCVPPKSVSITPSRKQTPEPATPNDASRPVSAPLEPRALLPSDDPPMLQLELTARELGQLAPFMALLYDDQIKSDRLANLKEAAFAAWEARGRMQGLLALTRNHQEVLEQHLGDPGKNAIAKLESLAYVLECPAGGGEEAACPEWVDTQGEEIESGIPDSVEALEAQLDAREGWPRLEEAREALRTVTEVSEALRGDLVARLQDAARDVVRDAATDFAVDRALAAGAEYVPLDPDAYHLLWIRDQLCLLLRRAHESGPGDETGPFSLDLMVGFNVTARQSSDAAKHRVWQCGKEALVMPLGVRFRNARFDPETETYQLDVQRGSSNRAPAQEVSVDHTRALALELGVPPWLLQQGAVRVEVLGGAPLGTDTQIQLVVPITLPPLLAGGNQSDVVEVAIILPDWTEGLEAGAATLRQKVEGVALARIAEQIPSELSVGDLIGVSGLRRDSNHETEQRPLVMTGTASIRIPGIEPIRASLSIVVAKAGGRFVPQLELGEVEDAAKRRLAELLVEKAADLLEVIDNLKAEIARETAPLAQMKADAEALRERIEQDLAGWGMRVAPRGECNIPTSSPMLAVCVQASVPFPTWLTGGGSGSADPIWIDATIDERGEVSVAVRGDLEQRLKELALARLDREKDRVLGRACQAVRRDLCTTLESAGINMERDSAAPQSSCAELEDGTLRLRANNTSVGSNNEWAAVLGVDLRCSAEGGPTLDFDNAAIGLVARDGTQRQVERKDRVAAVRAIIGIPQSDTDAFMLGVRDVRFRREGVAFDLEARVTDQVLQNTLGVDRLEIGTVILNATGLQGEVSLEDTVIRLANARILQVLGPALERTFAFDGLRIGDLQGDVLGSGDLSVDAHVTFDGLSDELMFTINLKPSLAIDSSAAKQVLESAALGALNDLLGDFFGNDAPLTIGFQTGPPPHFKGTIKGAVPGFEKFELSLGYRWSQAGLELDFPVTIPIPHCIYAPPMAFEDGTISVNDRNFSSITLTARGTLAECEADIIFYILGSVTAKLDRPAITTSNTAYVLGIPIFVNEGSISREGMVTESRTVGPMRAVVALDSKTRLDDDGFSFKGDLKIFDLDVADAAGTIDTHGLVEASGEVDWLIQAAEASFRSKPFPKNMHAGLKATAFKIGKFDIGAVSASVGPRRARAAFTFLDIDFVLVEGTWRQITRDAILKTILVVLEIDPEAILEMLQNLDDAKIPKEIQLSAPKGWSTSVSSAKNSSEGKQEDGGDADGGTKGSEGTPPEPPGTPAPPMTGQAASELRMSAYSAGQCKVSDFGFGHCFVRISHDGQRICSLDVVANRAASFVSDKRPLLTVPATHEAWRLFSPPPGEVARKTFTLAAHPGQSHHYSVARSARSGLLIVAPSASEELYWVATSPTAPCQQAQAEEPRLSHGDLGAQLEMIQPGLKADALGSGHGHQPPQAGHDWLATLAVLRAGSAEEIAANVVNLSGDTGGEKAYLITYTAGGENMAWLAFRGGAMPPLQADHPVVTAVKEVQSGGDTPSWLLALARSAGTFVAGAVADDGRALLRMRSHVLACPQGAECVEWPAVFTGEAEPLGNDTLAELGQASFETKLLDMLQQKVSSGSDQPLPSLAWTRGAEPTVVLVPNDQDAPIAFVAKRQQRVSSCNSVEREDFSAYFDENSGCRGVSTQTARDVARLGAQPRNDRPTCPTLSDVLVHFGETCSTSGEPPP